MNPYYWKFTWDGRPCMVGMTDFEKKRGAPVEEYGLANGWDSGCRGRGSICPRRPRRPLPTPHWCACCGESLAGRGVEVCLDCRLDVCPETCFWPDQGLCADCVGRGSAGSGSDTLIGRCTKPTRIRTTKLPPGAPKRRGQTEG